jgi:hypothetical protein
MGREEETEMGKHEEAGMLPNAMCGCRVSATAIIGIGHQNDPRIYVFVRISAFFAKKFPPFLSQNPPFIVDLYFLLYCNDYGNSVASLPHNPIY